MAAGGGDSSNAGGNRRYRCPTATLCRLGEHCGAPSRAATPMLLPIRVWQRHWRVPKTRLPASSVAPRRSQPNCCQDVFSTVSPPHQHLTLMLVAKGKASLSELDESVWILRRRLRQTWCLLRNLSGPQGWTCRAMAFLSTLPTGVVGSAVIAVSTSGRACFARPRWSR